MKKYYCWYIYHSQLWQREIRQEQRSPQRDFQSFLLYIKFFNLDQTEK